MDELLPPSSPPPGALMVAPDLLRERFESKIKRLSPATRRTYERGHAAFRAWFRSWLPTARENIRSVLESVRADDPIMQVIGSGPLVAAHVLDEFAECKPSLAPASVRVRIASIKWVFRTAKKAGAISYDVDATAPKVRPLRDVRGPSLPEARRMLAVADAQGGEIGARDGVLICLLLVLGLRRGEVAELRVKHFDGERLSILGKGHRDRSLVTVPPPVVGRINRYLALRGNPPGDAPLVASCDRARRNTDRRFSPEGILHRVRGLGVAAEVARRVSPHQLRHTAITAAAEATGGNVVRVGAFSRHARADNVCRYIDALRDDAGALAAVVAGVVGV